MKIYVAVIMVLLPSLGFCENLAKCILETMPSSNNDPATYAVMQVCYQKHPNGYAEISQGSGIGWFSYKSGAECAVEKSKETTNAKAAGAIRVACNCLYEKSKSEGASCAQQQGIHE